MILRNSAKLKVLDSMCGVELRSSFRGQIINLDSLEHFYLGAILSLLKSSIIEMGSFMKLFWYLEIRELF